MHRSPTSRALATLLACSGAVTSVAVAGDASAQTPTAVLAERVYLANHPDSALALFKAAVHERPTDASLHAWLAEAALRAGDVGTAARAALDALRLDPCNAQAHVVRASLFMPRFATAGHVDGDSVWIHLHRAVRCDPRDGNAWSDVWKYAVMRRDTVAERRALRALVTGGFLTRPQLAYSEWLLRSLPPRAVLVTGGDLDTYAPLAVQATRGVRRDVAVVNAVMLSAAWYTEPVLARSGLPYTAATSATSGTGAGGAPPAQRILHWLRRQAVDAETLRTRRPVAFALTAPLDTTAGDAALQLAGPYWLVVPPGAPRSDPTKIAKALRDADALDWRGPAVASSDRSPVRRQAERHPALTVARVATLAASVAPAQDARSAQARDRWIERFLERAGISRPAIEQALRGLRHSSSARPTG
jgi:hypothetical protein